MLVAFVVENLLSWLNWTSQVSLYTYSPTILRSACCIIQFLFSSAYILPWFAFADIKVRVYQKLHIGCATMRNKSCLVLSNDYTTSEVKENKYRILKCATQYNHEFWQDGFHKSHKTDSHFYILMERNFCWPFLHTDRMKFSVGKHSLCSMRYPKSSVSHFPSVDVSATLL